MLTKQYYLGCLAQCPDEAGGESTSSSAVLDAPTAAEEPGDQAIPSEGGVWIQPVTKARTRFIILMLGALSLITPFSVDMYLPAFDRIAAAFGASTSAVSLSLSTYFIGFGLGQIVYGPLLDRFGRKRPIYFGLALYIVASLLCTQAVNLRMLIALRFVQALGGCVAQVAALAMVRDFFPVSESARILSLLFLVIGVSPLLAPSMGSVFLQWLGWQWIFVALTCFTLATLLVVGFCLPESHGPDRGVSLKLRDIIPSFLQILTTPQFCIYAFSGAFSIAGLFIYVAGSPLIFMNGFQVSGRAFGGIFALLTMGFILGSQVNIALLKRFTSKRIFSVALAVQVCAGLIFFIGVRQQWYGMAAYLLLFFVTLSSLGLTYPNAAAQALAPFSRNAGSAAALLGFIQMLIGALASTGVGLLGASAVISLFSATAFVAAAIYLMGKRLFSEPAAGSQTQGLDVVH
ncbi:MAG: multidrug effflux MFS transporter [Bryobacteraceae bacterium]